MVAPAPTDRPLETGEARIPDKVERHAWRDIEVACPAGWEILRYGKDHRKGSLLWADREHHRLELSWARLAREPAMARVVSDERSRFLAADGVRECPLLEHPSWRGFEVRAEGFLSTRFSRWFPEMDCLLEAVFLWPTRIDEALQDAVLASIGKSEGHGGQHWRAFGIDIRFPQDWPLTECKVLPGSATMLFKPRENERYERVAAERHGMLDQWMKGSVVDWLREKLPAHLRVEREETEQSRGHTVHTVRGSYRRKGGIGRVLPRYRFLAAAWICPRDGRLHHFQIGTGTPVHSCFSRCCGRFSLQS